MNLTLITPFLLSLPLSLIPLSSYPSSLLLSFPSPLYLSPSSGAFKAFVSRTVSPFLPQMDSTDGDEKLVCYDY